MSSDRQSNLRPLSPFLKEKAKTELNEDENTRMQAIQDLTKAYKEKYPDLPLRREDDLFIIRFLRARKYNLEKALEIMYNYHLFLKHHPEMAVVGKKEDFEHVAKAELIGVLKAKAKNGSTVIFLQLSHMDVNLISPDDIQRGFGFMWDHVMEDEAAQICGVTIVEDFKDFHLSKARELQGKQKTNDQDMYYFLQNCLPLRLKGINFVHQPWWVSFFVTVAKVFMSQKLRSRFFYCGSDYQQLEKHFHLADLPTQIGGGVKFDFVSSLQTFEEWAAREVVDV